MTATDSKQTSTEEEPSAPMEEKEPSKTNISSSDPVSTVSSSPLLVVTTMAPTVQTEPVMEPKAVSVATTASTALSSPTEASPAKPAVTPSSIVDGTVETSPDTSHIASASDSLTSTGTTLVSISEAPSQPMPVSPRATFGNSDQEEDFPNVLTFRGVSVTLENNSVWKQFNRCGTEMILTKQGRRMFPYCRYRLAGLDPDQLYSLVLSIVPSAPYKYRWHQLNWEVTGQAEHQAQGLIRAFPHHYSPCRGSEWMGSLVSFYKLKLTNNLQDQDGHIILHSLQRYIPRIHVIPVPEGDVFSPDKPVVMGPESMTFTFPQTEFMTVTTYQNFRITQLKINHNPFAKGFREDGNNTRLQRITPGAQPVVKLDIQPTVLVPAVITENLGDVDQSTKNETTPPSAPVEQETRLILKPIMSTSANKGDPYVPCIRGNHALGELVLVQKHPPAEAEDQLNAVTVTQKKQRGYRFSCKAKSRPPSYKTSTRGSSLGYHKRRKRKINRRWANSQGKLWKAAAASPTVVHSPSLTVAMQPELDDVEGLLFVSFTSKEALEVHVGDKPASCPFSASSVTKTTPTECRKTVEEVAESDEEKITRLEAVLLQNLKVFKHRQVIHPVLQEVGLKLTSLDQTKPIDLQYLGVLLPLPQPIFPENNSAAAPGEEGLPFISRTGKTNDMTKIKGWRNKFMKNKETSSNCEGSQKNLSAFCSDMLDEYLESEAQYISERAAAFSTNPEGSVSYQLPAVSSSYVKTLDSILKHRNVTSKPSGESSRPCPLSHKAVDSFGLSSEAFPFQEWQSASTPELAGAITKKSRRKRAAIFEQNEEMTVRPPGITKSLGNLMQLERRGPRKTLLDPDRVSVALSAVLTEQMHPSQLSKATEFLKYEPERPECNQVFCRLGCVCASLHQLNRGPVHCRQSGCMFGCICIKSKMTAEESEQLNDPANTMTNVEHVVQSSLGSHAKRLWNRNVFDEDPDPLLAPKSAPTQSVKLKKRNMIKEEDKGPVYKYLESMMTCARVRGYNSKPPPEVAVPTTPYTSTPNTTYKPEEPNTDNLLNRCHKFGLNVKEAAEKTSQGSTSSEPDAKMTIEIQSACKWEKDQNVVLEALYRRMTQNRMSRRFWVGPYRIRPLARISLQKPSGSVVTYRIHISKPRKASDNDEDESAGSDEEHYANRSLSANAEEEAGPAEITPFLSGVIPAGILRVRTKPVSCQTNGLIQVNGKYYNQARLQLGNMGALHPANRLAGYLTGRLHAPADISKTSSQKSEPPKQTTPLSGLHIKAAGTVVPPVITARKTNDLKTPVQPPVSLLRPEEIGMESNTMPNNSPSLTSTNSVQSFIDKQLSSASPFQSISASSPVSLTVSPSLKTPSFLAQRGTYSFRICPPANQGTEGKNFPGVPLPGGFTLVQLPKPKRERASQWSQSVPPQRPGLSNSGRSAPVPDVRWLDVFARAQEVIKSAQPGAFTKQMFDEKMRSAENEKAKAWKMESSFDVISEDLSSDFSDLEEEADEDGEDEDLDIETVEEMKEGLAITKMKDAVRMALQDTRDSCEGFGLISTLAKSQLEEQIDAMSSHSKLGKQKMLERQRRKELRCLFDKLQNILPSDPKAPRLRVLSMAVEEVQSLVETSKCLEEQKRKLIQEQSSYFKELCTLFGKTDELIDHRLNMINEMQKTQEKTNNFRPFFSQLLLSRAALLEAGSKQPDTQPDSPNDESPELHPLVAAALNTVKENPKPKPPLAPLAVFSGAQLNFNAAPPQKEKQPEDLEAPEKDLQIQVKETVEQQETEVSTPKSQTESQPQLPAVAATFQDTTAEVAAPSESLSEESKELPACFQKPVPLPLIRSKTGRIILPASLKPLGKGYYTLTFMKPSEKKPVDGLSVVDPSKSKDKSLPGSNHSDSKSTPIPDSPQPLKLPAKPPSLPSPEVDLSKNEEKSLPGSNNSDVRSTTSSDSPRPPKLQAKPSSLLSTKVASSQNKDKSLPGSKLSNARSAPIPYSVQPRKLEPKPSSLPFLIVDQSANKDKSLPGSNHSDSISTPVPNTPRPPRLQAMPSSLLSSIVDSFPTKDKSLPGSNHSDSISSSVSDSPQPPRLQAMPPSLLSPIVDLSQTKDKSLPGFNHSGSPLSDSPRPPKLQAKPSTPVTNSSQTKDKSLSRPNLSDFRGTQIFDNAQTLKSQPMPPSFSSPLVLLNKASLVPFVALQAVKETSSTATVTETQGAACLIFNAVPTTPTTPDPDPPVIRRGRGRPRKYPRPETLQSPLPCKIENPTVVVEIKTEDQAVEVTRKLAVSTPPPAKRGRGRPRKDKSLKMWRPSGCRTKPCPSPKSEEESSDWSSNSFRRSGGQYEADTPLMVVKSESRPLTRGALGKDFPSAKKRSWIDVEKELEQEFEFE
ncbi:MAX gene-associated protein [Xyrichtys novacula]|uniref:MAX gene-associated protein n=1 Tax=Xyrichtys novacula TaxID=13765 RepID=A0AAV1GWB8_XYRNO|nr:MAX gene-associated protein [Xyrichtys novacula]